VTILDHQVIETLAFGRSAAPGGVPRLLEYLDYERLGLAEAAAGDARRVDLQAAVTVQSPIVTRWVIMQRVRRCRDTTPTQHRNMPQPSNERMRLARDRRRRGVRPVLVEVSQEAIEFLEVNGYLADRSDAAIAAAVSRFLVDSATG
jgi:hypothetical protein